MTLVCKLIQNTGCGAVFGYAKRVAGGFEIYFRPALQSYSAKTSPRPWRAESGVSEVVLEVPEQYQWEYKRFKHNGDKSLYDNLV